MNGPEDCRVHANDRWCLMGCYTPDMDKPFLITYCKTADVMLFDFIGEAKRMIDGLQGQIQVRIYSTFPTMPIARMNFLVLQRKCPTAIHVLPRSASQKRKAIRRLSDGEIFANVAVAASVAGVAKSTMYSHLKRRPFYERIRNEQYERCEPPTG